MNRTQAVEQLLREHPDLESMRRRFRRAGERIKRDGGRSQALRDLSPALEPAPPVSTRRPSLTEVLAVADGGADDQPAKALQ